MKLKMKWEFKFQFELTEKNSKNALIGNVFCDVDKLTCKRDTREKNWMIEMVSKMKIFRSWFFLLFIYNYHFWFDGMTFLLKCVHMLKNILEKRGRKRVWICGYEMNVCLLACFVVVFFFPKADRVANLREKKIKLFLLKELEYKNKKISIVSQRKKFQIQMFQFNIQKNVSGYSIEQFRRIKVNHMKNHFEKLIENFWKAVPSKLEFMMFI